MSKKRINRQNSGISESSLKLENDTLLNHSRQELIELAKNLSSGKYEKNSRQRDKLMQLLFNQFSTPDAPNSTG